MNLLIPVEKAIKLLTDRKNEIYNMTFNPVVWKERTKLDLEGIFPLGDSIMKVSTINSLKLESFYDSNDVSEAKNTGSKLLQSYIDYIKDHSTQVQKIQDNHYINLQNSLKEYDILLGKYRILEKQNKTFQDEYRAFLKKYKVEYDERYVWD